MSDVRCGLRSQTDNICALSFPPATHSLLRAPWSCPAARWLVSVSVEAESMIVRTHKVHRHVATITTKFLAIGLLARNGNAWTCLVLKLTPMLFPLAEPWTAARSTLTRIYLCRNPLSAQRSNGLKKTSGLMRGFAIQSAGLAHEQRWPVRVV